ncbi:MAG: 1-acyl-sn-glycerol-3-phosphate acyltransferase [Spirochaetales bacterium]|nr:1-acyl-sn-glycerol-3-phosphate acyltransferase [Spirochaetales bacterium]
MDFEKYNDIAPYRGADIEAAKERLIAKREYLGGFAYLLAGNDIEVATKVISYIINGIKEVKTYTDFQRNVTAGVFIPTILQKTTTGFSVSGAENIDPNKGYLFVSNHRDIILDCMLLDYALLLSNKPFCEMAVGDNLMANKFIEDIFRINGGIIVRRELPMREKYKESMKLSEYFVDVVSQENTSIWVAQKSGRSKDGIDNTQPAIIKMLYLSKKGSGVSFSELIKSVNIVPIAISYQYDPNDINKGREETVKAQNDGKYEKKKYEDIISMVRGLRCPKGHIHVAIGKPLDGEYENADEVAREIDRQIHTNYKLFNTNYIAYDYLENTDRFKDFYDGLNPEDFLAAYNHLSDDVRSFVLNSYANPVRMMLKETEGEE